MRINKDITDAWLRDHWEDVFTGPRKNAKTVWLDTGRHDGLRIRITQDGTITFYFRYRRQDRKREEIKLGRFDDKTFRIRDAAKKADIHRGKLATDTTGFHSPKAEMKALRKAETVEELIQAFLEHCTSPGAALKPKTLECYFCNLNLHVLPHLGSYKLIDPGLETQFRRLIDGMTHRGAACSTFRVSRRMGNWAREAKWIRNNPFAEAIPPKQRPRYKPRKGFFTPDEIKVLLPFLTTRVAAPETTVTRKSAAIGLLLLVLTGARKQEILTSTWPMWDLQAGFLRLVDSKTGPEDKPITDAACKTIEWIRGLDHIPSAYVCPSSDGNKPVSVRSVHQEFLECQSILFPDKPLRNVHDLRRSFVTMLKAQKVPLVLIAEILRHKTLAISSYYAQYQDDVSREALTSGAQWMREAMDEVIPNNPVDET